MLIRAAADSAALKAVVVEGASGQPVRDGLANGDRFDALLGGAVNTAVVAVFTNNLPPPSLRSQVSGIAPNSVFFIFGEHGQGGTEKSPNQQFYGSPAIPVGGDGERLMRLSRGLGGAGPLPLVA